MRPLRPTLLSLALLTTVVVSDAAAEAQDAAPPAADPTPVTATAAPEPNQYPTVLSGDFSGDGESDLFFFSPGPSPDLLYDFEGPAGQAYSFTVHSYDVQGAYRPFVGNFSGYDSADDIFWYRPGAASDMIWNFRPSAGGSPSYRVQPVQVLGSYTPVVGKFLGIAGTYGSDDIFWYGPGSIPDSIWDYSSVCSTCSLKFRTRAMSVRGTGYKPVAGAFVEPDTNYEDIFWYNPNGAESLWDFRHDVAGNLRIVNLPALQVAGKSYLLATADTYDDQWDDIVFAGPGGAQDSIWNFSNGYVRKEAFPEPLTGPFTSVVGVVDSSMPEPDDVFVYTPSQTRGLYYDFTGRTGSFQWARSLLAPVPNEDLVVAGPGPTARPIQVGPTTFVG